VGSVGGGLFERRKKSGLLTSVPAPTWASGVL